MTSARQRERSCQTTAVSSPLFFFLMIRHPQRSTLFPSTPLFRSRGPGDGGGDQFRGAEREARRRCHRRERARPAARARRLPQDRKSTRLNSSHLVISDAVFCLYKKTTAAPPSSPSAAPRVCLTCT